MARSQPYTVACAGGLVNSANSIDLLRFPGVATELQNFEVSIEGGYRRINGFAKFGGASAVQPTGTDTTIQGVFPYADGLIVCASNAIYFSNSGTSWIQINKLSAGSGDSYTTFIGKSAVTLTNQGQCSFAVFEGPDYDYGEVIIADGGNIPFAFRMEGTGALTTRTFYTNQITVDSTNAVKYITVHDHHLVAAGVENNLNTVYYSVDNDPDNFSGSGANSIVISDQIVGIRGFREDLFIFCQNSIHKLININDFQNVAVVPVAENVGCLSGYSIQEIGGDLLFLAPDGFRTVAGTARIGDVELGTISKAIQPTITQIAKRISEYRITSLVIREKSQYRLFYTKIGTARAVQDGIIGTLRPNGFEWSETRGIEVTDINSNFNNEGTEVYYHGDTSGYVFVHDSGNNFDGDDILARYSTPDYDYGDLGTLKTLHFIKVSVSNEGIVEPALRYSFDYGDSNTAQLTSSISLGTINPASIFGEAVFGLNTFGAVSSPLVRLPLQGSGHSNSFTFQTQDSKAPYTINGFYIDYIPSGRR